MGRIIDNDWQQHTPRSGGVRHWLKRALVSCLWLLGPPLAFAQHRPATIETASVRHGAPRWATPNEELRLLWRASAELATDLDRAEQDTQKAYRALLTALREARRVHASEAKLGRLLRLYGLALQLRQVIRLKQQVAMSKLSDRAEAPVTRNLLAMGYRPRLGRGPTPFPTYPFL